MAVSRQAAEYLAEFRRAFPAVDPKLLAARIATLLAHHYAATQDSRINAMIGADWQESLGAFPLGCIEKAVQWWRDNESRKPKPADIRKLAVKFFGETQWEHIERLSILAHLPAYDDSRMKRDDRESSYYAPEKRTDEGRANIARTLHDAHLPHSKEFCERCREGAAT